MKKNIILLPYSGITGVWLTHLNSNYFHFEYESAYVFMRMSEGSI